MKGSGDGRRTDFLEGDAGGGNTPTKYTYERGAGSSPSLGMRTPPQPAVERAEILLVEVFNKLVSAHIVVERFRENQAEV